MRPHSGNSCSGLCETPCIHFDCWQCTEVKLRLNKPRPGLSLAQGADDGLLSRLAAQRPGDHQQAVITRGILEGLCARAGIDMDWNDGHPIFRDDAINDLDRRYEAANRQVMEDKVRQLEKIAEQQRAGTISARAARSLATSAATSMDTMASDIIKQRVDETLVADAVEAEGKAVAHLKAQGASDDDIEAARILAGWQPPKFIIGLVPDAVQGWVPPVQEWEGDPLWEPLSSRHAAATNAENCPDCKAGRPGRHVDSGGTHEYVPLATEIAKRGKELKSGSLSDGGRPATDSALSIETIKRMMDDLEKQGVQHPTLIVHPSAFDKP